jgi:Flp pilus assembly pilin Flp
MTGLFKRLWREDAGQDLVEYMLLAAFIGLASYGGFVAIQNTIHSSYIGWDSSQQGIYSPPDPCCGS